MKYILLLLWIFYINLKFTFNIYGFAKRVIKNKKYARFKCIKIYKNINNFVIPKYNNGIFVYLATLFLIKKSILRYKNVCIVDRDKKGAIGIYIFLKMSNYKQKEILLCQNCKNPRVKYYRHARNPFIFN